MCDLEKELLYVGMANESNQLVIPGQITQEFDATLNTTMKEESEAESSTTQTTPKDSKQEKLKCTECDRYTTTDPDLLLRHVRKVHRGENPFQCVMCDYSTYNKSVFEDHVRWHRGIKPFKCSLCDYRSVSKNNLSKHEKNHRMNQCTECKKVLTTKRAYANHMAKAHGILKEGEVQRGYSCKHCKTKFPNKAKLRYHQNSYVKKCDKCFVKLCSTSMIIKHMADIHNQYFYKSNQSRRKKAVFVWMCQICKWEAKNEQKTLLHLIHHLNQKIEPGILDLSPLLKWNILPEQ